MGAGGNVRQCYEVVATVSWIVKDSSVEDCDLKGRWVGEQDVVQPASRTVGVHVREGLKVGMAPPEGVYRASREQADGKGFIP